MKDVTPFGWAIVGLVAFVVVVLSYALLFSTPPKVDTEKYMSYVGSLIAIVVGLFSPRPTKS